MNILPNVLRNGVTAPIKINTNTSIANTMIKPWNKGIATRGDANAENIAIKKALGIETPVEEIKKKKVKIATLSALSGILGE